MELYGHDTPSLDQNTVMDSKEKRVATMVTMVTRHSKSQGMKIVKRALRHGIIPEFKKNVPLKDQTLSTRWSLHILAVMSKHEKPDIEEVKNVISITLPIVKDNVNV